MTELERAARTAWDAMTEPQTGLTKMIQTIAGENRGPMPVAIALDMVQNVTGERDDAVTALIEAGANWLNEQSRGANGGELDDGCHQDAELVTSYIRSESLGLACVYLSHLRDRCYLANYTANPNRAHKLARERWRRWATKAQFVIDWCRKIEAEAYPVQS